MLVVGDEGFLSKSDAPSVPPEWRDPASGIACAALGAAFI
jgi:hypothetical protein